MAFIIRLDDACERRNIENWNRMETLLDRYNIKPLVGVIPHCQDSKMDRYPNDLQFWDRVHIWQNKGWAIALHGYNHVYTSKSGGINPVNARSEFAGESLDVQKEKITKGIEVMKGHGIEPTVFFAPAHTFDENTLLALKECSKIRTISDTIAGDVYTQDGFVFVPQQTGCARVLPLKTVTFCYHPNTMSEESFLQLNAFIQQYKDKFVPFPQEETVYRKLSFTDRLLRKGYFTLRKLRSMRK